MSATATTTTTIRRETAEQIEYLVSTGHYANAMDAVERAVDLLVEQEQIEHLRALIKVGMDEEERGELIEYTPEFRREARERARQMYLAGEEPDPEVVG